MNLAAKAPPASPRSWVNSCWMASFQASAATSPRANVINSANLSNTSALNFYSSFPPCSSSDFCGHARTVQADPPCVLHLTQPGTWRAILPNALYSPNCLEGVFCKVELSLLLGVCGLFFLNYLKTFDHLEGEAHYAALLALVLDVDGLLVIVDEDLRHKPAVVVEPLCPLGDISVLYLLGLLAHPHDLLPSTVSFYPEEAPCIPHRGALSPYTQPSAWKKLYIDHQLALACSAFLISDALRLLGASCT